jgi:hypothetical protein
MTAKAIARLERGLEDELGVPVALERPSNPEHGDYATNAAMRAAPMKRKLPMEIAEELRVVASGLPGVKDAAVAPPGFVNLQLDPVWYGEALGEILAAGGDYGAGSAAEPEKVQVEFVSANPTGPQRGTPPTEIPSPDCSTSRATPSSASSTSTTAARRSTSSTNRSTRGAGGRSRRRTATRATTWASWPSSTPTP